MEEMWQQRSCAGVYLQIQPTVMVESDREASSEDEDEYAPMYAGHHDDLSDALMVGQNFAVTAEEIGADFYVLKCTNTKRLAKTEEKDQWHNIIKKNLYVVEGLFYDKVNGRDDTYVLLDNKPTTLIYSHLVRCIRFSMSPREGECNVYDMSNDIFEQIYNNMTPEEDL
ncbi:hypothetical protein GOP47_0028938 [Adiantum capillus-veneris]|nr:hypothetical protein GOP47_0028938 [Adiantum capillus-veneris]